MAGSGTGEALAVMLKGDARRKGGVLTPPQFAFFLQGF